MAKNTIIQKSDQRLVMWIVAALIKSECNSAEEQNRNPLTIRPFYGRNSRTRIPLPIKDWSLQRTCYHEVAVMEDGSFIVFRKFTDCNREDVVACLNFPILGLEGRFDRPLDLEQYNYWVKLLNEVANDKLSLEKEVSYGN
jgi:hypothetical protein